MKITTFVIEISLIALRIAFKHTVFSRFNTQQFHVVSKKRQRRNFQLNFEETRYHRAPGLCQRTLNASNDGETCTSNIMFFEKRWKIQVEVETFYLIQVVWNDWHQRHHLLSQYCVQFSLCKVRVTSAVPGWKDVYEEVKWSCVCKNSQTSNCYRIPVHD